MDVKKQTLVTVCSECGTEACWNGIFVCENFRNTGVARISRDSND